MSNNRANRKRQMDDARQAGRDAFDDDQSRYRCPPNHIDKAYWLQGWDERQFETEMNAKHLAESAVQDLIDAIPCEATRLALEAIWEKTRT